MFDSLRKNIIKYMFLSLILFFINGKFNILFYKRAFLGRTDQVFPRFIILDPPKRATGKHTKNDTPNDAQNYTKHNTTMIAKMIPTNYTNNGSKIWP